MRYDDVARRLRALGCRELPRRGGGSHRKWFNPTSGSISPVPDWGRKDLKLGTLRAVVRQLGLDWAEFQRSYSEMASPSCPRNAEVAVSKQYSITAARNQLPAIVHEVENGPPVELTRRGRPVAVLLSFRDYERLRPRKRSLSEAIHQRGASRFGVSRFQSVSSRRGWHLPSPALPQVDGTLDDAFCWR